MYGDGGARDDSDDVVGGVYIVRVGLGPNVQVEGVWYVCVGEGRERKNW